MHKVQKSIFLKRDFIESVILSAHTETVGVSRIQDFFVVEFYLILRFYFCNKHFCLI